MKKYPSLPGVSIPNELPCIAFKKYDGSNLRFEFEKKKGWYLFGTNKGTMFDRTHPEFGCAIEIFLQKYASGVEEVIRKDKFFQQGEVTCFCEFFGPFSFSGIHDPTHPVVLMGGGAGDNNPKDVVLFDVNVHKKGLMVPRHFVEAFGHLPIAEIVYEGNLNASFTQDVREGKYPVVEGVVCKGLNPSGKPPHNLWMAKIKTLSYKAELEKRWGADWTKYWE